MNFIAIDFETANPCLSSICQVGVVGFDENTHVAKWKSFINPEDCFHNMNIRVHGIREVDVKDAPKFPHVFERLVEMLTGQVVVHHTKFDKIALRQAIDKHKLQAIDCEWLDSSDVVRMTWPELRRSGYGLKDVAKKLDIAFRHHDAEEDARAAGEILLRAIRHSGLTFADWISRESIPRCSASTRRPWPECDQEDNRRESSAAGPLAGEVVVFTGRLQIPRREASDLAEKAGCHVSDHVRETTTLLVVGDQDIRLLAGHEKSSKHRKAEELVERGHLIRILGESDFMQLID